MVNQAKKPPRLNVPAVRSLPCPATKEYHQSPISSVIARSVPPFQNQVAQLGQKFFHRLAEHRAVRRMQPFTGYDQNRLHPPVTGIVKEETDPGQRFVKR